VRDYLASVLLGAVILAGCATTSETSGESQLVSTAESWLHLLDEERYEEAWHQSASYFQAAIAYQDFLRFAQGVRHPLGRVTARDVWIKTFQLNVRRRPDGQYFRASFQTSFQHKSSGAFEHVLLENEAGRWKVTSYTLR